MYNPIICKDPYEVIQSIDQQERQIRDRKGNRYIRCEFCSKIKLDAEFVSYGGIGHINLGECRDCCYKK